MSLVRQPLPALTIRASDLKDPEHLAHLLRVMYGTLGTALSDTLRAVDHDERMSDARVATALKGAGNNLYFLASGHEAAGQIAMMVDTRTFAFSDGTTTVGGVTPTFGAPHNLLDGSQDKDTLAGAVVKGDIIFGNATPKWARKAIGTTAQILTVSGGLPVWADLSVTNVLLDGANHTDTTAAIPAAGDMIVRSGTLWDTLSTPVGNDRFLKSSGATPTWLEALGKTGAAKVDRTAQAASITATNLLAAGHTAGVYRVSVIGLDTTADVTATGVLQVTIGWTDNVGATTQAAFGTTLPLNLVGRASGEVLLRSTGSAAVTYTATVTGTFGTAQYALYIRTEMVG